MVIIFLGPPAVGKGTQANRLVKLLSAYHLSTGDLLRAVKRQPTELGNKVAKLMNAGKLVTDEIVLDAVRTRMAEIGPDANYLFDGFPRTIGQAETLDKILEEINTTVDAVIELSVPDEVLIDRAVRRGTLEDRGDDTAETVAKRLVIYREQTEPLVAFYGKRGLAHKIDGVGTVDEVFDRIQAVLKKKDEG